MSVDPDLQHHGARDERCELAVLLERAYRLALWLNDAEAAGGIDLPDDGEVSRATFSKQVASSELLDVLDEARARLVAGAGRAIGSTGATGATRSTVAIDASGSTFSSSGMPPPARSSVPPGR